MLLPISLVLNNTNSAIATRYESNFRGLQARQNYHVINVWEVDAQIAFQQPLPSVIPFVPVLRGGGEESAVR